MNIQKIDLEHSFYPELWRELSTQPQEFTMVGSPVWQTHRLISIVGSRHPMDDSIVWMERHLPELLRIDDIAVVSGGARGIDQLAHRIALECDRPTVCILPTGIKSPYPFGIEPLLKNIVSKGGAVLSTYADHQVLRKSHFAIRNRWIAGISKVCLVVEANHHSGSMLTAQLAQNEQRVVATLPVSPLSAQGLGNLQLIHDGAQLIRHSADLVGLFNLIYAGGPKVKIN